MPFIAIAIFLGVICLIAGAAAWKWSESFLFGLLVVAVTGVIAAGIGGYQYLTQYSNEHWETCHVTGKDRTKDMNGKSDARVYTSDCGVLQNIDSKLRWKFNSGDIQGQIPDQGVIRVRVAGWRHDFGSFFPNILEVQPVK